MDLTHKMIARVAGVVLLAAGVALAALAIAIALRAGGSIIGFFPGVIAVFCLLAGYRLALDRPNRFGSLLSPVGWQILAGCFAAMAAAIAVLSVSNGTYTFLLSSVFLGLLAYACIVAGRGQRVPVAASAVFPPETALLSRDGFTPSGFRCGIEILNDDRTPMEFVVAMLCTHLGFNEADAVRTMLYIHQRGGVLLPRDSFEDAKRIADAVTAEARTHNHPLTCRAVSLEEMHKP